jgi:glycerophosphoryl diester phosphodiesterase
MAASPTAIAGVCCNVGCSPRWPQIRLLAGSLARACVRCAQVPGRVATRTFVRRAHALGLDVHVWTINDRAEMVRFLDLGADGIMTDDIETLRDVLIDRGQWHPRVGSATP